MSYARLMLAAVSTEEEPEPEDPRVKPTLAKVRTFKEILEDRRVSAATGFWKIVAHDLFTAEVWTVAEHVATANCETYLRISGHRRQWRRLYDENTECFHFNAGNGTWRYLIREK